MTIKQQKVKEHIEKVGYCSVHQALIAAGYVSRETGVYARLYSRKKWCKVWYGRQKNTRYVWMIGTPTAYEELKAKGMTQ